MTVFGAGEGSHLDLVLLGVLVAVAVFLVLAYRTGIAYPILLVVGGAALGFAPGIDAVQLDPDVVLVIFLPPLLYSAAFFSSLRDLRDNLRPISLLAVGLVIATTLVVGVVARLLVEDLSWAAAFTLGAVLSPTDPVAATAIASRTAAPRRFITIVEGESLVNDSTALIAYKFAVAATLAGTFSLVDAAGEFVLSAVAGVAVGGAVAVVVARVRRVIDDPPTEIAISLLTPYFAYLPAEAMGVSAVLAAVTSGVYLGWHAPALISPTTRIQAFAVWEILVFALNAALFILLGLQLPSILERVGGEYPTGTLVGWALAIALAVIAVRLAWVFPATYLPRLASRRLRARDPAPPARVVLLLGWTGMRGAVSLAAALALPEGFPGRDLIIFLVYATILVTLLGEGLSLGPLIRLLDLRDDGGAEAREVEARIRAARAALVRLEQLAAEEWVREDTATRMRGLYEFRIRRFSARADGRDDDGIGDRSRRYQELRRHLLEAERAEVINLRNAGRIPDDVLHRIERDLDLEDARLDI